MLVDAEYRFPCVNVGSSGSSSDTQIFNCSKLRRKIKNGTFGLPLPDPLGEVEPDLHYETLQLKTTHKGRENGWRMSNVKVSIPTVGKGVI